MSRNLANIRDVTAARRGQIIQHVLVDGWSPAQAAASYGVGERRVGRWLAAYRRYGMASLRNDPAADRLPHRWLRRLRVLTARMSAAVHREFKAPPARYIALRRGKDGGSSRPGPDRHSLWN